MASAVRDVLLVEQLNEVDAIVSVETSMIDEGERLRPIDPVWAEALGELMLRQGQRTPIDICISADGTRFELAGGGGHRLAAAKLAGIEYLKAVVHSADADERRNREVAENLHRRDLDPVERAAFVAEAVAIQKRRAGVNPEHSGRSIAAQTRWQKALKNEALDANDTMSLAYGWTTEVADALGFNKRTIERDLLLYRRLSPSLVQRLRDVRHPILSNASQLRALAKLESQDQVWVVDHLTGATGREPAKNVSEALGRLRGANRAPSDPAAKHLSAFIGAFSRMSLTEKKGALRELPLPAGFRVLDPGQQAAPDEKLLAELVAAMRAAIEVLNRLSDGGEPVEDDDIHKASAGLQLSLMAVNAGAVPIPGGDA
ncbi:MAG: hypothetical protein CVT77_06415 [Alphaproteobacteria bacterium HGW-Alphaproteobacteria-16]|nr:MAG: hypothetical protein CVT77_06415 [Alphaproteobacteria bacterium HGW-Alphaproteobacteria-16]